MCGIAFLTMATPQCKNSLKQILKREFCNFWFLIVPSGKSGRLVVIYWNISIRGESSRKSCQNYPIRPVIRENQRLWLFQPRIRLIRN